MDHIGRLTSHELPVLSRNVRVNGELGEQTPSEMRLPALAQPGLA